MGEGTGRTWALDSYLISVFLDVSRALVDLEESQDAAILSCFPP